MDKPDAALQRTATAALADTHLISLSEDLFPIFPPLKLGFGGDIELS